MNSTANGTNPNSLANRLALFVATGCYSGYTPRLPGTAGSALCLLLWVGWAELGCWDSVLLRWVAVLICCLGGFWATKAALPTLARESRCTKKDDPQVIVIDEWAGMLIRLVPLGTSDLIWAPVAFVLFRFFDMTKPFPIRPLEKIPGAWGIMLDDIMAGLISALILWALLA